MVEKSSLLRVASVACLKQLFLFFLMLPFTFRSFTFRSQETNSFFNVHVIENSREARYIFYVKRYLASSLKLLLCSTQLSMEFSLQTNMEMPTIVGIFICISKETFMLSYV